MENIINSNEYTLIAIKVASDILRYERIRYEEIIKLQGDTITLPKPNSKSEKYENLKSRGHSDQADKNLTRKMLLVILLLDLKKNIHYNILILFQKRLG